MLDSPAEAQEHKILSLSVDPMPPCNSMIFNMDILDFHDTLLTLTSSGGKSLFPDSEFQLANRTVLCQHKLVFRNIAGSSCPRSITEATLICGINALLQNSAILPPSPTRFSGLHTTGQNINQASFHIFGLPNTDREHTGLPMHSAL